MYAFQAMTNDPNAAGFQSDGAVLLTRSGGVYNRESMSHQAISEASNSLTANAGMYSNRIVLSTFPNAYDAVCYK